MRKLLITSMMIWCAWLGSMANNVQTITVNGEQITGKTVKSMTFDAEENVTLLFSDDTSESIPAEQLKITIAYGTAAIKPESICVFSCNTIVGNSLNIRGIGEGENVEVFDAAGCAKASAVAGKEGIDLDTSKLTPGMYIVKAGKQIVKIIKK